MSNTNENPPSPVPPQAACSPMSLKEISYARICVKEMLFAQVMETPPKTHHYDGDLALIIENLDRMEREAEKMKLTHDGDNSTT